MKKLTLKDLKIMESNGYGYLGHPGRNKQSDKYIIAVANRLGVSFRDLNLFLDSGPGRYYAYGLMTLREIEGIRVYSLDYEGLQKFEKQYEENIKVLRKEDGLKY